MDTSLIIILAIVSTTLGKFVFGFLFDKIDFFPGYKNSIHYLSQGIYTSISIKNRILSIKNCFLLIKEKES